jgi:opacity protein-like surface antigen
MIRFKALAIGTAMAAVLAATALAGDLPPEVKMQEVSVKSAEGFYVRGDVGYAVNTHHGDTSVRSFDAATGGYSNGSFDSARFDGGDFTGAVGIGYQFNDLVRADITGDLFRGDFKGRFASDEPCAGGGAGTGCGYKGSSSYTAGSLMLNGYLDLGTLAGFTPYVGAGLGATRVDWNNVNISASCVDGSAGCGGAGASSSRYPGETDWRFIYALMAGVSYDVASNVKLDLGYRFSHVAGGDMFGYSGADSAAGAAGTMGRDGALSRHEIRIGLRVTTW